MAGDYRIGEMVVEADDWLAERRLNELHLSREGVLVLGIHPIDGDFIGTPVSETRIHVGDRLILYGKSTQLTELSERRHGLSGFLAHQDAVLEHQELLEEQVAQIDGQ